MKYKLCWAQGQRNVVMCAKETDGVPSLFRPRDCLLRQNKKKALRVNPLAPFVMKLQRSLLKINAFEHTGTSAHVNLQKEEGLYLSDQLSRCSDKRKENLANATLFQIVRLHSV